MPEWEGWSDDSQVVDVSRALRVVLTEAGPYGTSRSIDDVVANLALSVDPQVVFASAEAAGLLESARMAAGDTAAPGLPVTARGRRVAGEFGQASRRTAVRAGVARAAVLRWLYEQPGHMINQAVTELPAPWGWYYGEPFDSDEINEAFRVVMDLGLVIGQRAMGGIVVNARLTTDGILCVEHYDGSVQQWIQRDQASGTRIETYHQLGGNNAIGSANVHQVFTASGSDEIKSVITAFDGVLRLALLDRSLPSPLVQALAHASAILIDSSGRSPLPDQLRPAVHRLISQSRVVESSAGNPTTAFIATGASLLAAHLGWNEQLE